MPKAVSTTAALIAAVAFVAGCGGQSSSSGTHTTSTTHSHAAGLSSRCATGQLTITMHGVAGLGHVGEILEFQNHGGLCSLYGYPGVDGLAHGQVVVSARRTLRGYLGGLGQGVPEQAVTVGPGQIASALLEGVAQATPGAPCRRYRSLLVTPPNETHSVRFAAGTSICSPQIHPVVPGSTGEES